MFCMNCGTALPVEAKFCKTCGVAQEVVVEEITAQIRPSSITQPEIIVQEIVEYDICEIVIQKYILETEVLVAQAIGPQGIYIAAKSMFSSDYRQFSMETNKKLEILTEKLLVEGWELMGKKGSAWYSLQFRRQSNYRDLQSKAQMEREFTIKMQQKEKNIEEVSKVVLTLSDLRHKSQKAFKAQEGINFPEYEVCQIVLQKEGNVEYLLAIAVGETFYDVAKSDKVTSFAKSSWTNKIFLTNLVAKLQKEGWQPLASSGNEWFNLRFWRQLKNVKTEFNNSSIQIALEASILKGDFSWPVTGIETSCLIIATPEIPQENSSLQEGIEVCEILVKELKNRKYYTAEAKNSSETYEITKEPVIGNPDKEGWLNKSNVEIIVKKLKKAGWLEISKTSSEWYSLRFQRPFIEE